MITILTKDCIHFNRCSKLLNVSDNFFLSYQRSNILKNFRTNRDHTKSNSLIKKNYNLEFLKSKTFLGCVYAVGGTAAFFSIATALTCEKAKRIRNNYMLGFNTYSKNQLSLVWNKLKESQKFFTVIAVLNTIVFCAWKAPSLTPYMYKYFTLGLHQKHTFLPMLLSAFSHQNFGHLFFNMYCLYTFSNVATYMFGKEALMAFYLSAGLFSSLGSLISKSLLASTSFTLGASGAILGVVAATCILNPEMKLSIIFLPFITASATNCLYGLIAIDLTGILLKWQFIDHAGHLGGTLFGIWYVNYGCKLINNYCRRFAKLYNKIRSN